MEIVGYGYGYGAGYGDGYGEKIGVIGKHDVLLISPWKLVAVGCQVHTVDWWQSNWRHVANKESVLVSQSQVEELLCKC